jgi:hypothetical protein
MAMSSTDCRKKIIALSIGRQGRQLKYLFCLSEHEATANEGAGAKANSNIRLQKRQKRCLPVYLHTLTG